LKAGNFKLLQSWRLKQEALLKLNSKNKANNKVMSKNEVLKFMQTYQRVTQNMFKFAPKYSSIVLNLNSNHQIKSIKYNK
jgi:D-glycerate 3-kinase